MLIRFLFPLFDTEGGGGGADQLGEMDDLKLMSEMMDKDGDQDDDQGDHGDQGDDEGDQGDHGGSQGDENDQGDEGDEEGDEEGEGEEDEEEGEGEESEEDEEEETPTTQLTLKDVKSKYPKLFKEFPQLRTSFFRDQRFSEIFPDPDEAVEAAQLADNYRIIETHIVSGDSGLLLRELKQNNPDGLRAFASNFMDHLAKVEPNLYVDATLPVIGEALKAARESAKKTGDKNLLFATNHIANFIFGNGGEIPERTRQAGPHPAERELEEKQREWNETRLREADGEIRNSINISLTQMIVKGLPKMSEFTRKSVVRSVMSELDAMLSADKVHGRRMSAAWRHGSMDGYSRDSQARIINAYLAGAKTVIPSIKNRILREALGKSFKPGDKSGKTKEENSNERREKRNFQSQGRPAQGGRRGPVLNPSKIDYTKTSDADIFAAMDGDTSRIKTR